MQERYLGDSHDYAKYALLKHLSHSIGMRLGVNWYLTDPAEVDKPRNKDGEKRHHFSGRGWSGWEPDLLQQLSDLQSPQKRRLGQFYKLGILPSNAVYFDAGVPVIGRSEWHARARLALAPSDLIFVDPDNGFEVASMTKRRMSKYALYSEAANHVLDGKSLVSVQFARQCDPVAKARLVRRRLSDAIGRDIKLPVVRARLAPNLLFVACAPPGAEREFSKALQAFAANREKIELIG